MRRPKLMDSRRLVSAMEQRGLDAVIAVSPKSVFYTSGCHTARTHLVHRHYWPGSPRIPMTVTGRGGAPTLIVGRFEEATSKLTSWVSDMRFYTEYVVSPIDALGEVLRDKGLADKEIGIEKDYLCARYFQELTDSLPNATFVESDSLFEEVTGVKTAAEIALLKRAADTMDQAFIETFSSAEVGNTEKELRGRMISNLRRLGADSADGLLHTGENALVLHAKVGNTRLEPGDIIRTDFVATFDGYPANLSRNAVVGQPTDEQRDTYHRLRDCQRKTIGHMRAGVPGCDVFDYCMNTYGEAGYEDEKTLVGHNLGLDVHDRPMLVPSEEMELQPDMVVCIEPLISWYHIQDEVLITEDEPILFSDLMDTAEMFVIE